MTLEESEHVNKNFKLWVIYLCIIVTLVSLRAFGYIYSMCVVCVVYHMVNITGEVM